MFFADRSPGMPGLAVFLNAGDPPLPVLPDLIRMLDDSGVDCLELAVPFPNSPTDGPVIRRSADRALAAGTTLGETLALVAAVRPHLRRLRIALLADWSFTVRPAGLAATLPAARDAGCDGLLLHGLPPRLRDDYYEQATGVLPVVATCYPVSPPATLAAAARDATAYVYLVTHYGRSGGAVAPAALAPVLSDLRAAAAVPVAAGFGVRSRADADALHRLGADAVIVGSAAVARVEAALAAGTDPIAELHTFVSPFTSAHPEGETVDHPRHHRGQDRRVGQRPEPPVPARG